MVQTVFWYHDSCTRHFCKGPKPGDVNHVPWLKTHGLYNEVAIAANHAINHASNLIVNVDNNSAEHVNSMVAKFVGGRHINYLQRGLYQLRCLGASVALGLPEGYHRAGHKSVCKSNSGKYTKVYQMALASQQLVRKRQRSVWLPRARRSLLEVSTSGHTGPEQIMDLRYSTPT